jgi:hypothetical protein
MSQDKGAETRAHELKMMDRQIELAKLEKDAADSRKMASENQLVAAAEFGPRN